MSSNPIHTESLAERVISIAKENNNVYDWNNWHTDFPNEKSEEYNYCYILLNKYKLFSQINTYEKMLTTEGMSFTTFDAYRNSIRLKKDVEDKKMWYETENAKKQFESYPATKMLSIIAIIISAIAAIGTIVQVMLMWKGK